MNQERRAFEAVRSGLSKALLGLAAALTLTGIAMRADATTLSVSPSGTVAQVRQIRLSLSLIHI